MRVVLGNDDRQLKLAKQFCKSRFIQEFEE